MRRQFGSGDMKPTRFQHLKILGLYVAFAIGILSLFIVNEIISDDVGVKVLLGASILALAMVLVGTSALTSYRVGHTCETRLEGAASAGSVNAAGALIVAGALALLDVDFSELIIQITIASFLTGFFSSFVGSMGLGIPFTKPDDLQEDDLDDRTAVRPDRTMPATSSGDGYDWLQLEDGTTWYRVAGGFPDPNHWNPFEGEDAV